MLSSKFICRILLLFVFVPLPVAQVFSQPALLSVSPAEPSTDNLITLNLSGLCAFNSDIREIRIDNTNQHVHIAYAHSGFLCPATEPLVLGPLPFVGSWSLSLYRNEQTNEPDPFDPSLLVLDEEFFVKEARSAFSNESPREGEIVSGVGLIRGWACDAKTVEVSIDGGLRIPIAYGTSRGDTLEVCGDDNNGYGLTISWGRYEPGPHTMAVFVNGALISEVNFVVGGLGLPFTKGLSGSYVLPDFPGDGDEATILWSESAQNFIITDVAN